MRPPRRGRYRPEARRRAQTARPLFRRAGLRGATLKRLEDPDGRQLLLKRAGGSWSVGYSGPGTGTIEEIAGLADDEVLERIRSIRKD
ncbi:hypothetical protein PJ267_19270 [Arthrobacter sp. OVS8]|nr:hypothetical protein PJ267_19270 [Arthrobacter sp. OVS8]